MEKYTNHSVSQSYALRVHENRRVLLRPELCLVTLPVFINAALCLSSSCWTQMTLSVSSAHRVAWQQLSLLEIPKVSVSLWHGTYVPSPIYYLLVCLLHHHACAWSSHSTYLYLRDSFFVPLYQNPWDQVIYKEQTFTSYNSGCGIPLCVPWSPSVNKLLWAYSKAVW